MSRELVTVRATDTLADAWRLLHQHSIKSLPVVDDSGHVVGIVTLADFVRRLVNVTADPTDETSLGSATGFSGTIRETMTRAVRVASDTLHVVELLPLFSEGGHHHLPVVNADKVLVGMITQSDVVRALHKAVG